MRLRKTLLYSLIQRLIALVVWDPEVFDVLALQLKTILASTSSYPKIYDNMSVCLLMILFDESVDVRQRFVTVRHCNCYHLVMHQLEEFIIVGVPTQELWKRLD